MISWYGWPDFYQEHNALKPHCMNRMTYWVVWQLLPGAADKAMMRPRSFYLEHCSHSVEVWAYWTLEDNCEGTALLQQWERSSSSNLQSTIRYTEDDLKILSRILSTNTFKIPPLIHLCDEAWYFWKQSDTLEISTSEERQTLWCCYFEIGQVLFEPHFSHYLSNRGIHRYWLPGTLGFVYRVVTFWRIFLKVRIYNYWYSLRQEPDSANWLSVDLVALDRRSRGWVLGQDEERKKFLK